MPRRSRSSSIRRRPAIARSWSSSSRSTIPSTKNRQGNDRGTSYRSAIFYTSDEQSRIAQDTIADVDASGLWPGKVVTEVAPVGRVLGGRARASGLPGADPERLHLPLRAAELEAAGPRQGSPAGLKSCSSPGSIGSRATSSSRRRGALRRWRGGGDHRTGRSRRTHWPSRRLSPSRVSRSRQRNRVTVHRRARLVSAPRGCSLSGQGRHQHEKRLDL